MEVFSESRWTHSLKSPPATHTCTLPHALTLFTLPRYSSPSLHRANTSSPSLTPPILRRETERVERGRESRAHVKWKSDLFAEYFAAIADRGVYGPGVTPGSQTDGLRCKGVKIPHPLHFLLDQSIATACIHHSERWEWVHNQRARQMITAHMKHTHRKKTLHDDCCNTVWLNEQRSLCSYLKHLPGTFRLLLSQHLKNLNRCMKWLCRHYLCSSICSSACTQDRRRIHNSACSLLWFKGKSGKLHSASEGYLSSRTPFRRGHSDSWAGWTWNALMSCGSPLPNYCPFGCAALRVSKKWRMCMYVPVCAKRPRVCVSVKPSARRRWGDWLSVRLSA